MQITQTIPPMTIDINAVQSRMLTVRDQQVLLDRDVAALYGVETRIVNQAVRNNPDKFPAGYVVELSKDETEILRSKILTLEEHPGKGHHSKHGYKVFSERGTLYAGNNSEGRKGRPSNTFNHRDLCAGAAAIQ